MTKITNKVLIIIVAILMLMSCSSLIRIGTNTNHIFAIPAVPVDDYYYDSHENNWHLGVLGDDVISISLSEVQENNIVFPTVSECDTTGAEFNGSEGNSIKTFTFPIGSALSSIDSVAFQYETHLEKLIFESTTPIVSNADFLQYVTCNVYVGNVEAYKTAWSSATGYVESRIRPLSELNESSSVQTGVVEDIVIPTTLILTFGFITLFVVNKKERKFKV